MSDLQIGIGTEVAEKTSLVGIGPGQLGDFNGDFILEVVPSDLLIAEGGQPGRNQFGGISGKGCGSGVGVTGSSQTGVGVKGSSQTGIGIMGVGQNGVIGVSATLNFGAVGGRHTGDGYGVVGDSNALDKAGVLGRDSNGEGVRGEGKTGVIGVSSGGFGVVGESNTQGAAGVSGSNPAGTGVEGVSNITGFGGVAGRNVGTDGYGVIGDSNGENSSGVLGRNPSGAGIRGEGRIGGRFAGTGAQLCLVPGTTVGHPTVGNHEMGEIYLDVGGSLFVCIATGGPGVWLQIQTQMIA